MTRSGPLWNNSDARDHGAEAAAKLANEIVAANFRN